MRACFFLLVGLVLYGCSTVKERATTQLIYSGHLFTLPNNIFVIVPTTSPDHMLILKYGPEKGKKYLAFSEFIHNDEMDFGCSQADFFAALFTSPVEVNCGQEPLDIFREAFIDDRDAGVWRGNNLTVYFSVHAQQSFLFIFDKTGQSIMVDTDFLPKAALKRMVDSAL